MIAGWNGGARRSLCGVALALALGAALLCGAFPAAAWADDERDESENAVNTQQLPDSSFIYDTSIAALGGADAYYDEQTVQVVGEVVGDNISASLDGRRRWITLAATEEGGTSTVSVLMSAESAARIDAYGKYGVTGTMLQVRGTFHLVCPEHEGLTDLHADIVSVVEKGQRHEDPLVWKDFVPGAVLVLAGLVLAGVFYYLRERQR